MPEPMPFFRKLDRYVWSELRAPFVLGVIGFSLALLLNAVFQLAINTIEKRVPFGILVAFLGTQLPVIFLLTMPMATLLAVLVGVGRLAVQNEIIALRAAGVSPRRVFTPVFLFGVLVTLLSLGVSLEIAPRAKLRQKQLAQEIVRSRDPSREIEPGVFYLNLPGAVLYARNSVEESAQGRILEGVFLFTERPDNGQQEIVVAQRGRILFDRESGKISLLLDDGEWDLPPRATDGSYHRVTFKSHTRTFAADTVFKIFQSYPADHPQTLRAVEIPAVIERLTAQAASTDRAARREDLTLKIRKLRLELARRYAVPLSALVLTIAGFPLACQARRGGRFAGMSQCLLMLVFYYALVVACDGPAEKGTVPPSFGVFLPLMILSAFAALLWLGLLLDRGGDATVPLQALSRMAEWPSAMLARIYRWLNQGAGRFVRRPQQVVSPTRRAFDPAWTPFSRLDRYLASAFLRMFVAVLVVLLLLGVIFEFRSALSDIPTNTKQIPWGDLVRYVLSTIPGYLRYSLPLAAMFGATISLAGLARHGEIVALKAAGLSPRRLAAPLFAVMFVLALGYGALQETVVPSLERRAQRIEDALQGRRAADEVTTGRRWLVGNDGRIWSFLEWDAARSALSSPLVISVDLMAGHVTHLATGQAAQHSAHGWSLVRGTAYQIAGDDVRSSAEPVTLLPYSETPELFGAESRVMFGRRQTDQLPIRELWSAVKRLQHAGAPIAAPLVRLYERLVTPLIPLLLMAVGIPLVVTGWSRKSSLLGFGLSLLIALAFWSLWAVAMSFGREGWLSPPLAALSAPLLLAASGAVMLARAR